MSEVRRKRLATAVASMLALAVIGCETRSRQPEGLRRIEMAPAERVVGVWVYGFEESSFFPGATSIPDRNDSRRYRVELAIDPARVEAFVGPNTVGGYRAVRLTLVARRNKYPYAIDCDGGRWYTFVADRILGARSLGRIDDPDPPPKPFDLLPYTPFKPSGEKGVVARLEQEAIARCVADFRYWAARRDADRRHSAQE